MAALSQQDRGSNAMQCNYITVNQSYKLHIFSFATLVTTLNMANVNYDLDELLLQSQRLHAQTASDSTKRLRRGVRRLNAIELLMKHEIMWSVYHYESRLLSFKSPLSS